MFVIYLLIQIQIDPLWGIFYICIIIIIVFFIINSRKDSIGEQNKFKAKMKEHERLYQEKKSSQNSKKKTKTKVLKDKPNKFRWTTNIDKTKLPKSDVTWDTLDLETRKKLEKTTYFIDDDGSLNTTKGLGSDIDTKFLDKLELGNPPIIDEIIFDPNTYSEIFNSKCPAFSNVNEGAWYLKEGDKDFIYRVLVTNHLAEMNISRFLELNDFRQIRKDKNLPNKTSWKGKGIKMDLWVIQASQIHDDPSKFGNKYVSTTHFLPSEREELYVIVISGV